MGVSKIYALNISHVCTHALRPEQLVKYVYPSLNVFHLFLKNI